MSDSPKDRPIWALLKEYGLLPELGDRSVRGGSPAIDFDAIVQRVRECPEFPMTPRQVDQALHDALFGGPGDDPGRIFL
jgi:hypothetical protein